MTADGRGSVETSGNAHPRARTTRAAPLSRSSHRTAFSAWKRRATSSDARYAAASGSPAASGSRYRQCTMSTRAPAAGRPHDLDPPGNRRAAHLVSRPRVVEHERRPWVALEIAELPATRGRREDHGAVVTCVPHRNRVDEPFGVERREHAHEPRIDEARDEWIRGDGLAAKNPARLRVAHARTIRPGPRRSSILRHVND